MEEKEVIEQLEAENKALRKELTEKATIPTKSANDIQYFTNIDGIYAKDAAGRMAVEELRTLITRYSQTVLWENSGTTNPDTITLSEAWSDFDELVVVTVAAGGDTAQYETTKHPSVMAIGGTYTMWFNSDTTWGTYTATSDTVFTKVNDGGVYHISKIIGIKY